MSPDTRPDPIDALLSDGRSALADLAGASPGGGQVTSWPAYGPQITPGDVIRHHGAWMAVIETAHNGVLGLTRLALIDAAGDVTVRAMVSGEAAERRGDVRLDPDTLYKLCDRSCAARYIKAAHSPGAAGVADEQLAAWLEEAHETSLDAGRLTDLHDLAHLARCAVQVLDQRDATHLIRDVAVWVLHGGTGEALITVDRPGLRVCTFTVRPESFRDRTYREALAGLLATARTQLALLDALAANAARRQDPALAGALDEADAALAGESNAGEHEALHGLAEAVRCHPGGPEAGGLLLTAGQLREWAGLGRDLTAGELARLAGCIPRSSIPDAIGTIIAEAPGLPGAGGGGQDEDRGGRQEERHLPG